MPLGPHLLTSLRPLVACALASAAVAWLGRCDIDARADATAALVSRLSRRGLEADAADVLWLDGPSGTLGAIRGGARAIVRAHTPGEPDDLWLVRARLSPQGTLLNLDGAWNLTGTTGVDEGRPVLQGGVIAFDTRVDPVVTAVHTIDLAGRNVATYADFTRVQRAQTALANLQNTGQPPGVVRASYALDPVAEHVDLAWRSDGAISARADGREIVIDVATGKATVGAGWVRAMPEEKARPGNLVTWSVDRVRAMPVFGEEKMQWLKFVAFTALDKLVRARESVLGERDTEKEVRSDMGGLGGVAATYADAELGWPPAPVAPILTPVIGGEGRWIVLAHDPFVAATPGAPPAFATTFLRADKDRRDTRVYVTMWDPRQIALHMEAGTVEPVSATGEAGPGMIPRSPEVMRRVVAGFNGGFQALHGEYGMQANDVQYLPPKPYAATVLELRDGTTAFGSWPAATEVPADVLSYRQNLTALVQDGTFNPWRRTWWGGTPKGWADEIHTTRSGICLTREGYVGYFWGNEISADVLARSMTQSRCTYAIHLDMNPGLAGFEFYDAKPEGEWKPLGRAVQADWEYEGTFKAMPGWHYRARRMVRGMSHQGFPQYMHIDARDFFYLTLRPTLPGASLAANGAPPEGHEGQWETKSLPQHGFPWAVAETHVRAAPDRPDVRLRLLRVDPRLVRAAGAAGTTEQTPTIVSLTDARHPRAGESALWLAPSGFLVGEADVPGATALVDLEPMSDRTRTALCVQDEDGMLAWAELPEDAAADGGLANALDATLRKLGCSRSHGVRASSGATTPRAVLGPSPSGAEVAARLVRGEGPSATLYFHTPVVGPGTWRPLQMQRVRYFYRPPRPEADAGTDIAP